MCLAVLGLSIRHYPLRFHTRPGISPLEVPSLRVWQETAIIFWVDIGLSLLQLCYFGQPPFVTLGFAESGRKKDLGQLPGKFVPNDMPANANQVHIVVFHALVGGKCVGDQGSPDTAHFVGNDTGSYPAAADCDSTLDVSRCYGPGKGQDVIRVVVRSS